eukprot:2872547-Amphidinium_carterae.1
MAAEGPRRWCRQRQGYVSVQPCRRHFRTCMTPLSAGKRYDAPQAWSDMDTEMLHDAEWPRFTG